jgi:hypothetical protein
VNCRGIAGASLALQIANKYPKWKPSYVEYCRCYGCSEALLGHVHWASLPAENSYITVASVFGQVSPGRGVMTKYGALGVGLVEVGKVSQEKDLPLYIPYKIGCGLAGGDWGKVSLLIEEYCPNAIIVQM